MHVSLPRLQKTRIQVWLFENTDLRIEGKIIVRARAPQRATASSPLCARAPLICTHALSTTALTQGFDEYMNLVLDDAEELSIKKKTRKALGRILLKGDNITLMMST